MRIVHDFRFVLASVAVLAGASAAGPASTASAARPATSVTRLWAERYDGTHGSDVASAVVVSPDGSTVFVTGGSFGPTSSVSNPTYDFATVAYDAATGAKLWASRYNGPADAGDFATSLALSSDGNTVFVTGGSAGAGSADDYATIAYVAATGAQRWVSRYNGPGNGNDVSSSVAASPDGSTVFVTGGSVGTGSDNDYATVAYSAATGAQRWVRRYNGPGNGTDFARQVVVGPGGGRVFVTGGSTGVHSNFDYATIAYGAATGARQWVRRYDGPASTKDYAHGLTVGAGGHTVVVTGSSRAPGSGVDYATVAYNARTGAQRWLRRYNGPGSNTDNAGAIVASPRGHLVFVTGYSYGKTSKQDDTTLAYNAATGAQVWIRRFNGSANSNDLAQALALSPDGRTVFVAGFSTGAGNLYEYSVVSYRAATGAKLWAASYSDGNDCLASAVALGPGGRTAFVTGTTRTGGNDYLTVGYQG